jgi:eukaryotic-like serine/threonine-protein kinase
MQIGELVAGRYEVEEVLGRGGMSSVYRAHDRVLERDVALKVLHERYADDPEYVERFRREARAIAKLSHPNIVTVIDRGEVGGWEYIVFELVRGENLKDILADRGALPVAEALALVHQAARGLAFAHEHGIVHRDVKPHNVLVDEDGVAKVTDFGIARSVGLDEGLTETGTILGTSDYLSPEQAVGRRVDERSDQYSLGVLLYEALTGDVPYPGDSMLAVAMRHVNDPVPSVRERRPDVPARVDALVRRAMAKRPEERFPSLDAFIAALEACMLEEAESAGSDDSGATQILTPTPSARAEPARAARREERERGRERDRRRGRRLPWQLVAGAVVLFAGAMLVGALATGRFDPAGDGGGQAAENVRLAAVRDHDPDGDDAEHPERVQDATDGDPATYWPTETYASFDKDGVGLVVDAGRRVELSRIVVVSQEPGFTAGIQAGESATGPFEPVSDEQEVGQRTTFELDTGGERYRYYLLWITALEGRAAVNEIRAG